ncbi:MAG: non-heme chloroperoxidase [Candidatus Dependentiae bacterium]|nr:non-heme chloroperoxidase [Candidatus Dependentiae bacterium]
MVKHVIFTSGFCLAAMGLHGDGNLDFSSIPCATEADLPALHTWVARDGETLSYRLYGDSSKNLMLLLHGSGSHGGYLDFFARNLADNALICVPTMRGHYKSGSTRGACSYVGQLEDDLCDLLRHLKSESFAQVSMVGNSSGGGLAIRFSGGKYGSMVNRYALLAPVIPADKELMRKEASWVTVNTVKIPLLVIANMLGISWFNTTKVITFNMPQERRDGTETLEYSYNLLFSMNPRFDYLSDVASIDGRSIVLVGRQDECIRADAYARLFKKSPIYIFDDLNHFTLVRDTRVIEKVREFCIKGLS